MFLLQDSADRGGMFELSSCTKVLDSVYTTVQVVGYLDHVTWVTVACPQKPSMGGA